MRRKLRVCPRRVGRAATVYSLLAQGELDRWQYQATRDPIPFFESFMKMLSNSLALLLVMASGGLAMAANVPAGVKLHETQELVRNN
ncbi:MAG: hypothetical protein ACKVP1_10440, partial [Burkholderiaceae bacterium]